MIHYFQLNAYNLLSLETYHKLSICSFAHVSLNSRFCLTPIKSIFRIFSLWDLFLILFSYFYRVVSISWNTGKDSLSHVDWLKGVVS